MDNRGCTVLELQFRIVQLMPDFFNLVIYAVEPSFIQYPMTSFASVIDFASCIGVIPKITSVVVVGIVIFSVVVVSVVISSVVVVGVVISSVIGFVSLKPQHDMCAMQQSQPGNDPTHQAQSIGKNSRSERMS